MVATHILVRSISETHRGLAAELDTAIETRFDPGEPRKGFEYADTFLATASRHLNAVENVVVPAVQKHVEDSAPLVHEYVEASKDLEAALARAKAREYHSYYAVTQPWTEVWHEVRDTLDHQRGLELELAGRLCAALDDTDLDDLSDELHRAELVAPSRPHPHAPHLGLPGRMARRVLHTVDSFWDAAEGRMVPETVHKEHKSPGRMGQYLLADPRFDEDES